MQTQVLISGGGIAGLTLALRLVRAGVRVTVLEKYEKDSIMYKGELLQPKSLEIMAQLGLLEQLLQEGQRIPQTVIVERVGSGTKTTDRTFTMDYRILPEPYNFALMIPHDKLKQLVYQEAAQSGLLTLLRPAHIIEDRGKELLISVHGETVSLKPEFVVGAEGKFSVFRERINVGVRKQSYNHQFLTVTIDRPESMQDARVISHGERFIGLFPLPDGQVRTVLLLRGEQFKRMKRAGIESFHQAYHELVPELKGYVDRLQQWKEIQLMIPLRLEAARYVAPGKRALIGDAAHSVHPMAGEGMNMAIQDADVLGSLLAWMLETGRTDEQTLQMYEQIRKPRAQFVASVSHLSALAYSFPNAAAHAFRARVLGNIARSEYLQKQYMVNISGLGIARETLLDRVLQVGFWPTSWLPDSLKTPITWFSARTDYPWLER